MNNSGSMPVHTVVIDRAKDLANNALATLNEVKTPIITASTLAIASGASMAQSATLTVDTDMFIQSINQWLPMAMTIAAIGVGIAGGFKLAQFVGRMIVDAFDGRL